MMLHRDWPPIAFDIGFLSISSINLVAGKEPLNPQDNWYWPPVVATWLFTILILVFLHRASNDYLIMRKQFYSAPAYNLSSRSILISNIPKNIRSSEELKTWLESTCNIHYPIQQIHIGQDNPKLMSLVRKYKKAVCRLEDALAAYARGKKKAMAFIIADIVTHTQHVGMCAACVNQMLRDDGLLFGPSKAG